MTVMPVHDRVLLKRIKEQETVRGGIIIPDTEKSQEGEVAAVATGKTLEGKQGDRRLFGKYAKSRVAAVLAAAVLLVWGMIHAPGLASGDPASKPLASAVPAAAAPTPGDQVYAKLPMRFEANRGQSDSAVQFLSRGPGYSLFLTSAEAVLVLSKTPEHRDTAAHLATKDQSPIEKAKSAVLRMELRGANTQPQVSGEAELPGKSHYFIGGDPTQWRTNVPNYAKVRYSDVYAGIDVIYYGNGRQLEYDFVVAPGADPGAIRLAFKGSQRTAIDRDGDLVLETEADGEEVRLRKPVVYQMVSGSRQEVPAEYVLLDAHEVRFKLGRYDVGEPLVIDPVLSYSTYLGGSGFDAGQGIAVDGSGHVYVTGQTTSTNFPTTANAFQLVNAGSSDAFVAKLDPSCSALLYSTYLGGGADDRGWGIAVDSSGNAYVTGFTASPSPTFPLVNAFQSVYGGGPYDAFVAKLNPAGSALLYSTYLGGSADDNGYSIAVDSVGDAYVTGLTASPSPTFPLVNAFQSVYGGGPYDAFVAKLHPAGSGLASLVYSTYLGGNSTDIGRGIAVDGSGNAYVTGATQSTTFPLMNPLQPAKGGANDAFVAKLHPAGSALVYSTYLGGSNDDQGLSIAVDGSGNAYVTGRTQSPDFPTAHAFQGVYGGGATDAFVAKLNAAGSAPLVYSTFLGGENNDIGYGIAVDGSGNAYVTGTTQSTTFPTTANAFQLGYAGGGDAFVAKLARNAAGSLLLAYSTYLGSISTDDSYGIAVDGLGNAYVTGTTFSPTFPTVNPFQSASAGGGDAFIAKISSMPVCHFTLNQTTFAPGSSIIIQSLHVNNPEVTNLFVEYKLWIDLPGGGTYSFWRGGDDGPPGSNQTPPGGDIVSVVPGDSFFFNSYTLVQLVTPGSPLPGAYSINCRLEDPVSGQDLVVDKTPFIIVP